MVKRISMGKQVDGTYGLKISRSGIDVDYANDEDLALDSNWTVANVIATGIQDMQQSSGTILTLYDGSSLGYVPFVEVWLNFTYGTEVWQLSWTMIRCFVYWESGVLKANFQMTQDDPVWLQYFIYARPKP